MTTKRTPDHRLLSDGAPYKENPSDPTKEPVRATSKTPIGEGFAMCSCGARSPMLRFTSNRRLWHQSHTTISNVMGDDT